MTAVRVRCCTSLSNPDETCMELNARLGTQSWFPCHEHPCPTHDTDQCCPCCERDEIEEIR